MSLLEKFNEKMSKSKVQGSNAKAVFEVAYSTGFLSIDYLNGCAVHVESKDRNFIYDSCGIIDGSANTIIGRSGSGKSTLLTQIVGNIIRPFVEKEMDTIVCIDDIEKSLPQSRKEFLLGLTQEQLRYVDFRVDNITTENVYERIKALHDTKINDKKHYTYDTGLYDTYGERIFKLIPSIYVIDSIPMLMPESLITDTELGSSMDASSIAKNNTMLFKKIAQLCTEANIILFTINHINDDIQMGFIPKAAQISGLKQGERLPGGKAALYLANNMFRVDDSNTLKADKDYYIDGSIVNLTIIKSRTNCSKKSVPLIFNKSEGRFDEVLSLFHLLNEEGLISGAGASLYLDSCPDIKFSKKTFKNVIESSPELQQAFAKEVYSLLKTFLADTKRAKVDNSSAGFNIRNMINAMANPSII